MQSLLKQPTSSKRKANKRKSTFIHQSRLNTIVNNSRPTLFLTPEYKKKDQNKRESLNNTRKPAESPIDSRDAITFTLSWLFLSPSLTFVRSRDMEDSHAWKYLLLLFIGEEVDVVDYSRVTYGIIILGQLSPHFTTFVAIVVGIIVALVAVVVEAEIVAVIAGSSSHCSNCSIVSSSSRNCCSCCRSRSHRSHTRSSNSSRNKDNIIMVADILHLYYSVHHQHPCCV